MGITTIDNPEVQGLMKKVQVDGINIDYREYVRDAGIDKGTILYGYVLGEDGAYTQDPEEELCCIVQKGEMWITKSSVVVKCRMHGTCLGDLDNRDEGGCFAYAPRPEDRNGNG